MIISKLYEKKKLFIAINMSIMSLNMPLYLNIILFFYTTNMAKMSTDTKMMVDSLKMTQFPETVIKLSKKPFLRLELF